MRYKEGEYISSKNVLYLKKLDNGKGIFQCPFCHSDFEGWLGNVVKGKTWHCGCQRNHYEPGAKVGPKKIEVVKKISNLKAIFKCPYHNDNEEHFFTAHISGVTSGNQYHCGCLHTKKYMPNDKVGPDKLILYKRDENNSKKAWFICPYHKEEKIFSAYISNILNHNSWHCGCQNVNSKGELKIFKILTELKINFYQQKTFDDLTDIKKLRFDFYLPDYNCCIEYDGRQHYGINSKYAMIQEDYEQIKKHDKIKDEYCKNHNIHLVRIPYTDYNILDKEYLINKINN